MNGANMIAGVAIQPTTMGLAKADPSRAFEPGSVEEGVRLAGLLAKSGLLGDLKTPEQVFAVIATGRELGLSAMQSLRSIHLIKGKPILSADLVAALVKSRSEVCEYFRLVESTATQAVYQTKRRGEPEPTTMAFTIEDAKRAQVTSNLNWSKYPGAMLRARCITALARAVYPDLVMGIYDPDELDVPVTPHDMTAEIVRPAPPPPPPSDPSAVDAEAFSSFCKRIDEAETTKALDAIAKDVVNARKGGVIATGVYNSLGHSIANKRKLMAEQAEEPKPSHVREPGED